MRENSDNTATTATTTPDRKQRGLVGVLVEQQERAGLSDRSFAALLGIAGPAWYNIKAGKRNMGVSILGAVLRKYPALKRDVLEYIKESRAER